MEVNYEKKKVRVLSLIFYIVILVISLLFSITISIDTLMNNFSTFFRFFTWIVNIVVIMFLYTNYKRTGNVLDFTNVFVIFLFMFCNGQGFLYSIGIPAKDLSLLNVTSKLEMIESTIYFYFSMLFFQIGSLCVPLKKEEHETNKIGNSLTIDGVYVSKIKKVAFVMLIISIFPYCYNLIINLKNSISYGYSYLYTNPIQNTNFTAYFSKLFIPSLLLYLYSLKNNKRMFKFIIIVLILISVCNLIIGARGDSMTILVALLLFKNQFIKKYKGVSFAKILLYALLASLLIPTILNFRKVENKSFSSFAETVSKVATGKDNFIVETISELGYTSYSYTLTRRVVPKYQNFKYGESYFASLMMIVPSFFTGGYSFAYKAALDIWLQNIHSLSYGPGFSLLAETYYNFGWYFGIAFFFIFGILFTKIFHMYSENKDKQELLKLFSLILLYNSLLLARFPFHSFPRNFVYMFIIPYFFIINNKYSKKGVK